MPEHPSTPELSELEALFRSREATAVLDSVLGFTPSGVIIASGPDGLILRVSDYAARMLGRPRSELEGISVQDAIELVPAYDATGRRLSDQERPLWRALRGETVFTSELWIDAEGQRTPIISSAAPIRNWRGALIGVINSIADLRPYKALERSLRDAVVQRETLYRELTHRVKNHLQIMTALVALEARNPALSTRELAEQIKGQLQALAAVYRGMDRAELGARIEARTFLEEVCHPYATDEVSVEAEVAPPDLALASEVAGPVGMLVNEAVRNAHKHAFPDHRGRIHVSLTRPGPGCLRVEVADNGVGWGGTDPSASSHGLDLMRLFAKQMNGELELGVDDLGGALVAAEIPDAVKRAPGR